MKNEIVSILVLHDAAKRSDVRRRGAFIVVLYDAHPVSHQVIHEGSDVLTHISSEQTKKLANQQNQQTKKPTNAPYPS